MVLLRGGLAILLSLVIRNPDSVLGQEIVTTTGNDVILKCPISGTSDVAQWFGPPNGSVELTSEGNVTEAGYEYVNSTSLKIISVQTSQSGEYKCVTSEGVATVSLKVNSYDVQFEFPGSKASDGLTVFWTENSKLFNFTCVAKNGFPKPVLSIWIKNGSEVIDKPLDISNATQEGDNTYSVTATASMNATLDLDGLSVFCGASFQDNITTAVSDPITLKLTYPPYLQAQSWSRTESGRQLNCHTVSRPATTIKWMVNGELYTDVPDDNIVIVNNISQLTNDATSIESYFTISDATKDDNNMTIECELIYMNESRGKHPFELKIEFAPTSASVTTPDIPITLTSGIVDVNMTCATDSSLGYTLRDSHNTSMVFKWFYVSPYSNQRTKMTTKATYTVIQPGNYSGDVTKQIATFSLSRNYDGASVICVVDMIETTLESPGVELELNYPPVIVRPVTVDSYAYKFVELRLPCVVNSNPLSNITWYFDNGQGLIAVNTSDTEASDNMVVLRVNPNDTGVTLKYVCKSTNGLGQVANKSVQINIESRPEIPILMSAPERVSDRTMSMKLRLGTRPVKLLTYYVQYKESDSSTWMEVSEPLPDSLNQVPGTSQTVNITGIERAKSYDVRLKAVDAYGRQSYTGEVNLMKDDVSPEPVPTDDDSVSRTDYDNAILISVLVTAGAFIIIIVIIVIVLVKKPCSKSQKYNMG